MKKVIILNGPPNCGKDAIADYLVEKYPNVRKKSFKERLTSLTQMIHNVSTEWWEENYTRELKEKPSERLSGLTPREALIKVSETVIKPNYGKDYFGKAAAESLEEGINVFSDGGFKEEIIPLTDEVGSDNIIIVRITRPDCSFEGVLGRIVRLFFSFVAKITRTPRPIGGDSRNYLNVPNVKAVDVDNDGSLEEFKEKIDNVVNQML